MALALTAAQPTGTFERSKSSAGKEKKGKEETMTFFMRSSRKDYVGCCSISLV